MAVFPTFEASSAEVYGSFMQENRVKATASDAEYNNESESTDNVADVIVEIETSDDKEKLEKGRGEVISRFDVLSISGVTELNSKKIEKFQMTQEGRNTKQKIHINVMNYI